MRTKKSMRNSLDSRVYEQMKEANDSNANKSRRQKALNKMKDEELFKVNLAKEALKQKKEDLKKDRFKRKTPEKTSISEFYKVKKIQGSLKRRPQVQEEATDFDMWADDSGPLLSKKHTRDQKFLKTQMNKVKAVVLPAGGQSYNPSGNDH